MQDVIGFIEQNVSPFWLFVGMILTGLGAPFPEEVFIILGGIQAANGNLETLPTFGALLSGGLLGDCIMYGMGFHFGRGLLNKGGLFSRFITPERERHVEELMAKHGLKVLLFARFLVGVRSPVYITTGILRVNFRRFVLFDTVCATLVIGAFFSLSYFFADQIKGWWEKLHGAETVLTVIVISVIVLGCGIYFWRHHRSAKNKRKEEPPADSSPAAASEWTSETSPSNGTEELKEPATSSVADAASHDVPGSDKKDP